MTSKPSDPTNRDGWHVHKFGGTSLGDADCFRRVADILLDEPVARQAVVVSAMAKTTDALLGLVAAAEQSAPDIGRPDRGHRHPLPGHRRRAAQAEGRMRTTS